MKTTKKSPASHKASRVKRARSPGGDNGAGHSNRVESSFHTTIRMNRMTHGHRANLEKRRGSIGGIVFHDQPTNEDRWLANFLVCPRSDLRGNTFRTLGIRRFGIRRGRGSPAYDAVRYANNREYRWLFSDWGAGRILATGALVWPKSNRRMADQIPDSRHAALMDRISSGLLGLGDFAMDGEQGFAVRPAKVFVFALSSGADPGLGAIDALTDSRLGKTGAADFGEDVFPVHATIIRVVFIYVNTRPFKK